MASRAKRLLDTDTLSAIMRSAGPAVSKAQAYLNEEGILSFSLMTRYEILRGLKAKDAERQLESFHNLCALSEVLPLTPVSIDIASEIYADLKKRGALIGDADILIAATAMEHDAVLVSGNQGHFSRITGLQTEDWLSQ